jgi:hypothetical protein
MEMIGLFQRIFQIDLTMERKKNFFPRVIDDVPMERILAVLN